MNKYKTECTGFFKYENGHWLFSRKNQWTTTAGKLKNVAIKLKKSTTSGKPTLDILIDELKNTCRVSIKNNNHQKEGLFHWLTSYSSPPKIERAQAICLKHFVEHILSDPSNEDANTYGIVSNIVGQCVTVQIGTSAATPSHSWFFLSSRREEDFISEIFIDYVLAFPKLFFKDPDNFTGLKSKKEILKVADLLKSHRVLYETKVEVLNSDSKSLKITINSTLMEYPKGRICGCIPIPGKEIYKLGKEPATVKTPEVVITSPNVVEALLSLSQVWQDKFAKSILISAPPGSGKEQFSHSIAYSSGREVNPLSFAEGEKSQLEEVLFGKVDNGEIKRGLISKSEEKVLFLDEVHHPVDDAGIRGSLLRVLESDQFTPVGSDKPIDIINVLFVLATSKPLKGKKAKGLSEIPPIDFWTRMTHVITIKHPFESVWGIAFPDILDSYFSFFWWDRLEKYFKIDPRTYDNLKKIKGNKSQEKWVGNKATDLDYKQRLAQIKELRDIPNIDGNLKKLAEVFRERFTTILKEERIQPHEISIRGLRNIVTRIFSISATAVTQGIIFDKVFLNELEKKMDPIIYEILEIATLDS